MPFFEALLIAYQAVIDVGVIQLHKENIKKCI